MLIYALKWGVAVLDKSDVIRYSRQIILDGIGKGGQEKLSGARVLVAGAGGLGSPALYYLAAAGVGEIGIADFDNVGLSNLQRQIIHFTDDLGKKKTVSAAEKIKRLNPSVKINTHSYRLKADNIMDVVAGYDVVIDAVDNIAARYIISDCCHFALKPLVEAAVIGFEGQVMTIIPGESACYRCMYSSPPGDGVLPSCAESGIMGMVAGWAGSIQALEAVKIILGLGDLLTGRIFSFNALDMSFCMTVLDKNPECPLCSKNPSIKELEDFEVVCGKIIQTEIKC